MAAEVQLRREGKRDLAAIVKELCKFSPRRGTTIKKSEEAFFKPKSKVVFLKTKRPLMAKVNLSTHHYEVIRQQTTKIHKNMYPGYKIKAANQLCYPSDVNVTETFAEINLRS
ncbi:hypothetical protein AVEN_142164-1 [Araneus ventricosus]|uniref:Uncharacterized protein n=1 Tax=Araneus ventricosus TaxID=182803 RepID=A0A4Y2IJJ1_ARAVE|nr:hypothetical protein AVEN_142164-1 [Araneus ventricosus]